MVAGDRRMRIFIYEFVTGGGWSAQRANAPPNGLVQEGGAMRNALATDLAAGPTAEVLILHDRRLGPPPPAGCRAWHCDDWPSEREAFQAAARWAEATAIIAPNSLEFWPPGTIGRPPWAQWCWERRDRSSSWLPTSNAR